MPIVSSFPTEQTEPGSEAVRLIIVIDWHFYGAILYLSSLFDQYIIKVRLPGEFSSHKVSMVISAVPKLALNSPRLHIPVKIYEEKYKQI